MLAALTHSIEIRRISFTDVTDIGLHIAHLGGVFLHIVGFFCLFVFLAFFNCIFLSYVMLEFSYSCIHLIGIY